MNGGNPLTLVDAYLTTVSLDYESIEIVTNPAGAVVSRDVMGTPPDGYSVERPSDYNGSASMYYLVFTIPDATAVTKCAVITP